MRNSEFHVYSNLDAFCYLKLGLKRVYKLDVEAQQRVTMLKLEFEGLDETKATETSTLGRANKCSRDGLFPVLSIFSYLVGFLQL